MDPLPPTPKPAKYSNIFGHILDSTWTPEVRKICGPRPVYRAQKAIMVHTFGVQDLQSTPKNGPATHCFWDKVHCFGYFGVQARFLLWFWVGSAGFACSSLETLGTRSDHDLAPSQRQQGPTA